MTPNDALTHLQRTRGHSYNTNSSAPSLRRRLTRSPSPSLSCMSLESKSSKKSNSSYSSDSDTSGNPMRNRKRRSMKSGANGHATNGIEHVLEETSVEDEPPVSHTDAQSTTQKIDWEIPRKTLHSSIGFLTLALYTSSFSLQPVITVLSATLVVVLSAEYLRFRWKPFASVYEAYLGFLMRESEKSRTNGVVWYLCGVLFVLLFYPLDIAVVSILILSWADTAASTVGRMYGKRTPKLPDRSIAIPIPFLSRTRWPRLGFASRKSMAGFIASTTTGFLITTSFWGYFSWMRTSPPVMGRMCFSNTAYGAITSWMRLIGTGVVGGANRISRSTRFRAMG